MKKKRKETISRVLFYVLVFLLPLNLGYHFLIKDAYQNGILIDYLIPTLYLQDILAALFITLNLDTLYKNIRKGDKYLIWFLFTVFLASVSSMYIYSSLASFGRLLIYVLTMLIVKHKYRGKEYFNKVVYIFGVTVTLLSLLAVFQWKGQGSVFDNYLFFGEQPYTVATPGINVESFFSIAKVPPYGTFRHPNIFGGILSIILIWFLFKNKKSRFMKVAFILGVIALFLTLSKFAWISFLLGVGFYFLLKKRPQYVYRVGLGIVGFSISLSLFLPFFPKISGLSEKPSYYRRADLLSSSYRLIGMDPYFGVGYGASTAYINKFLPSKHDIRFAQPTHNIFVLLLVEAGALALLFFTLFLFNSIKKALKNPIIFISLTQIVFLGIFDHYFFTIHQPQLLMWLILGFV